MYLSRDYAFEGDADLAVQWAQDGVNRAEGDLRHASGLVNLVFAYSEAGRAKDAEGAAKEIPKPWPDISIDKLRKAQPFRYEEDWDRFASALKAAGLSE